MFHAIATDLQPLTGGYEAPTIVGTYASESEATAYCAWENERSDYSFFYVMPVEHSATIIAHRFADAIEDYCGDDIEAIRAENATLPGGVCATHDYCDANMPMAEAFESVTGRLPIPMSDDDASLWSLAWSIAKRDRLTAAATVAVED